MISIELFRKNIFFKSKKKRKKKRNLISWIGMIWKFRRNLI